MAKSIKRVLSIMLVLVLVLSLVACGGNADNDDNNAANVGSSGYKAEDAFDTDAFLAQMPEKLRGTTLTFMTWYDIENNKAEWDNILAFEQASGINVDVIAPEYKQYNDKLAGLVATGDSPDVIRMSEPNMAWMKSLQPITNTGYDFSSKEWDPLVKEYYSVDGVQYAANLSYTPYINFGMILYATDIMEEWGFEDPWELWKKGEWTWEKMNQMAGEWIKQGPNYYGWATVNFSLRASTMGIDFVSYDGKQWALDLYSSEVLDAWKYIVEDRENRLSIQGTNSNFGKVKTDTLFGYQNSVCLETFQASGESKMRKRGVLGYAPAPKVEGEEYYMPIVELLAWGVPIGAKNPEAVPYFISWYANLAKYDMDTYYYDEHCQEIFTAMVTYPKRFLAMSDKMFNFDANPLTWNLYTNAASSQITTFIQSQEYRCLDALAQYNDVLSRMNKETK